MPPCFFRFFPVRFAARFGFRPISGGRTWQPLREKVLERHIDPFHTITEEDFDDAVRDLDRRIPSLSDNEVVVELARLMALLGDGHTALWLYPGIVNGHTGFSRFPVAIYRFSDGWYVIGVAREQAEALGRRVLEIDGTDVEEVFRRVSEIAPRDNAATLLDTVPRLMTTAEVLFALGITARSDEATLTLAGPAGAVSTDVRFQSVATEALPSMADLRFDHELAATAVGFLTARDENAPAPLWLRHPPSLWFRKAPKHYWSAYLEDSNIVYTQITRNENHERESMSNFFARVLRDVDRLDARLVIDLRLHGGGDNTLNKDLVRGILSDPLLDRPGRLFVIIGRRTFSAGSHLVTLLETWTNAVFVGEQTGGSPNHFADNRGSRLPHSRLAVHTSTMYWQNSLPEPFEDRDATTPDLLTPLSFSDYKHNRDPALEAILAYEHVPLTTCGIRRPKALCSQPF